MKKITVALCVDDRGGMAFNNRRQSRDRVLIKDLMDNTSENIYIEEYSEALFSEYKDRTVTSPSPLEVCPDGGTCFIERESPEPYIDIAETVILYRWNKKYPFDLSLNMSALESFKLIEQYEFEGNSHEKITKEVYKK